VGKKSARYNGKGEGITDSVQSGEENWKNEGRRGAKQTQVEKKLGVRACQANWSRGRNSVEFSMPWGDSKVNVGSV